MQVSRFSFQENHEKVMKKATLKIQQNVKCKKHSVFTEKVIKIALSINNDKRIKSIDLKEAHAHKTSKDIGCKKQKTKLNNVINRCKM